MRGRLFSALRRAPSVFTFPLPQSPANSSVSKLHAAASFLPFTSVKLETNSICLYFAKVTPRDQNFFAAVKKVSFKFGPLTVNMSLCSEIYERSKVACMGVTDANECGERRQNEAPTNPDGNIVGNLSL